MLFLRKRKYYLLLVILLLLTFYLIFSSNDEFGNDYVYVSEIQASKTIDFNTTTDLLVFLHIQKTGGSDFDRSIVKNLMSFDKSSQKWRKSCESRQELQKKFKYKKFYCPRDITSLDKNDFINNWYFSRQTFGWYCGLHVDYAGLKSCLNEIRRENMFLGKIYYITILRDPIKRYISEWNHITRGNFIIFIPLP
jgi:hypothetical protein